MISADRPTCSCPCHSGGPMAVKHVAACCRPPLTDHPHTDPGDGRSECDHCGKFVWPVTHSCKGVPVTPTAVTRALRELSEAATPGEWTALIEADAVAVLVEGYGPWIANAVRLGYDETRANVALIAAAVNYVRALLATPAPTAPACAQCGPGYRIGDEGCRHTDAPTLTDSEREIENTRIGWSQQAEQGDMGR